MYNVVNEDNIKRLSDSIIALAPDFPMDGEQIRAAIKARGLDGFVRDAGGHAAALSEIAGLLSRPVRGGAARGGG